MGVGGVFDPAGGRRMKLVWDGAGLGWSAYGILDSIARGNWLFALLFVGMVLFWVLMVFIDLEDSAPS